MSREIKFKYIWSNPTKTHFLSKIFTLDEIESGDQFMVLENEPLLKNYRRVAILQWTGLLDKNGREIYGGDVIIIDNKHASLGIDIIKTVLFKNGMFGVSEDTYSFISLKEFFVGVESTKKYISNYGEIFEEYKAVFEVIGNIYENPELITEVKNG